MLHNFSQTPPELLCVNVRALCVSGLGALSALPPFCICYLFSRHTIPGMLDRQHVSRDVKPLHAALLLQIGVEWKCKVAARWRIFGVYCQTDHGEIWAHVLAKRGLVSSCSIMAFSSPLAAFSRVFRSYNIDFWSNATRFNHSLSGHECSSCNQRLMIISERPQKNLFAWAPSPLKSY